MWYLFLFIGAGLLAYRVSKSGRKRKNSEKTLLTIVSIVFILLSVVVRAMTAPAPAEPTSTIGQGEQEIEDGWVRIRIEDVGSIDYPTDFLELQSGDYRDIAKETSQVLGLGKSDFTLQQVGLNDLKPSAFEEYRRVILQTSYLNPGEEVFRANEKYTMSRQELAEFQNEWIDQLQREFVMLNIKLVESISIEIKEVNGMYPLVHTYKRQLRDNPVVLVRTYLFWNYDKIHHLAFSYRVVDEEECRDIYEKILYSFRLD